MPTVPEIPNTDRVLDATATAAQDTFAITWPVIADSELLAVNDLVVLVDGVEIDPANYSFEGTDITGLTGMWNGGDLVLDTPCAGGERVIVYSKRDPRRTGYFLEGKSLPFTELDKLQDDMAVMMRDLLLGVSRAVKMPIDDYLDGGNPDDLATEILAAAETVEGAANTVAGLISGVIPAVVKSATTTAPPVSPADGDAYAIPAGASGAWVGHSGQIALRESGAWNYLSVLAGHTVSAVDTLALYSASSGKWTGVLSIPASMTGGDIAAAHTIAASISRCAIEIDCDVTLAAGFTATVPVHHTAGRVTLGNYDFTFSTVAFTAGITQVFNQSGTGRVKGTMLCQEIHVAWWVDGSGAANNRAALQAAITLANNSTVRNANISLANYQSFDIGTAGVTSTGGNHPNIYGMSKGVYAATDSTNLLMTPPGSVSTPAILITGTNGVGGGSVRGLYIDGGLYTTGVEIRGTIGFEVDVAGSTTVGNLVILHNATSGQYTENCKIRLVIPGLGLACKAFTTIVTSGNDSFSGTELDIDVGLNPGTRTEPIIEIGTGCFLYNGKQLNLFVHNNGADAVNLINNLQSTPLVFASGEIRIETDASDPVAIMKSSGGVMYFGGAGPFVQAAPLDFSIDMSKVIFCDAFDYSSGVVHTKGATVYQQSHDFTASSGVEIIPAFGGKDHVRYSGRIFSTADNSYVLYFDFTAVVDQSGSANGAVSTPTYSLSPDTNGYGNPSLAMNSSKHPVFSNGSWPGATYRVQYTARQL